ncbi:MAG: hypothetical protein KAR11_06845 [Phycisphaerae bacterium]|nr:hypothetical protein [Phycisphaerae bacterium]
MLKKLTCLMFCATFLLVFAGCWQVVHVTDPAGNPIEGVNITTSYQDGYLGPSGPSGKTNSRGDAYISFASQPYPMYMNYYKKGYWRSTNGYSTNLKIQKVLKPVAGLQ